MLVFIPLQEIVVLYRRVSEPGWLEKLTSKWAGHGDNQIRQQRQLDQIALRIYRDIPLPTWKIIFPEKLIQFRPLEGLRADLLSVAGRKLWNMHFSFEFSNLLHS